jgi:hypothetical protein
LALLKTRRHTHPGNFAGHRCPTRQCVTVPPTHTIKHVSGNSGTAATIIARSSSRVSCGGVPLNSISLQPPLNSLLRSSQVTEGATQCACSNYPCTVDARVEIANTVERRIASPLLGNIAFSSFLLRLLNPPFYFTMLSQLHEAEESYHHEIKNRIC